MELSARVHRISRDVTASLHVAVPSRRLTSAVQPWSSRHHQDQDTLDYYHDQGGVDEKEAADNTVHALKAAGLTSNSRSGSSKHSKKNKKKQHSQAPNADAEDGHTSNLATAHNKKSKLAQLQKEAAATGDNREEAQASSAAAAAATASRGNSQDNDEDVGLSLAARKSKTIRYYPKALREGWASKKGGRIQNWRRRYFVLMEDRVDYYAQPLDRKPKGSIPLVATETVARASAEHYPHGFVIIPTPEARTYHINVDKEAGSALESVHAWLTALQFVLQTRVWLAPPLQSSRSADEFVLESLLNDTASAHHRQQTAFLNYTRDVFCEENVLFYLEVQQFRHLSEDSPKQFKCAQDMFDIYIRPGCDREIGIDDSGSAYRGIPPLLIDEIRNRLDVPPSSNLPRANMSTLFDRLQRLVFFMILPTYKEWKEAMAERASGGKKQISEDSPAFKCFIDRAPVDQLFDVLFDIDATLGSSDFSYRRAFLLNVIVFSDAATLLSKLEQAFKRDPSTFVDQQVCMASGINVLSVLQEWIREYPCDFHNEMRSKTSKLLARLGKSCDKVFLSKIKQIQVQLDRVRVDGKHVKLGASGKFGYVWKGGNDITIARGSASVVRIGDFKLDGAGTAPAELIMRSIGGASALIDEGAKFTVAGKSKDFGKTIRRKKGGGTTSELSPSAGRPGPAASVGSKRKSASFAAEKLKAIGGSAKALLGSGSKSDKSPLSSGGGSGQRKRRAAKRADPFKRMTLMDNAGGTHSAVPTPLGSGESASTTSSRRAHAHVMGVRCAPRLAGTAHASSSSSTSAPSSPSLFGWTKKWMSGHKSGAGDGSGDAPTAKSKVTDSMVGDMCVLGESAKKLAYLITLMDFEKFARIDRREFVDKGWTDKKHAIARAPNVLHMVDVFNVRSFWVATQILQHPDAQYHVRVIRLMIDMADHFYQLRNFFSLFAVISGLSLSPVFRLKSAWNALSGSSRRRLQELKTKITDASRNFRLYRKNFKGGVGHQPQIPHIAIVLKDLFGFEEVSTREKDGQINFSKFRKQWSALEGIFESQKIPYSNYQGMPVGITIESCVDSRLGCVARGSANGAACMVEEELWERSYEAEPRGWKPPASAAVVTADEAAAAGAETAANIANGHRDGKKDSDGDASSKK